MYQELVRTYATMSELSRELNHRGDFDAHAPTIRALTNANLIIIEYLMEIRRANPKS